VRTHADALAWVDRGTAMLAAAIAPLDDQTMSEPSRLPDWSRKHLIAHVAANADALCNLVRWAQTGQRTPMYSSPDQRGAAIEAGSRLAADELVRWLTRSARALADAMAELDDEHWSTEVVTAQGRTVRATEIPWLRAREVCVHTVDLGTGVTFADLPGGFLSALVPDIRVKRGLTDVPAGPLPEVAAYLAGRPHGLTGVPHLGPWL